MSSKRKAMALLAILALVWGSSFILMKRGLEAYSPDQVGAIRMLVSFLCLLPYFFSNLKKVPKSKWKYLFLAGVLGNGIPSVLFPLAETQISSAMAGMLNSLTPLFTFILGLLFFGSQITRNKIGGIALGMTGALLLVTSGNSLSGDYRYSFYVVLSTICYAVSVNVIRYKLSELDSVTNTVMALLFTGIPMGAYLFTTDFVPVLISHPEGISSFSYVVILAVFGTAVSTVLFNDLIKISGALTASSVTYLIPVVAVLWGLGDNEFFTLRQFAGLILVLAGVYLINLGSINSTLKNTARKLSN